MYGEKIVELDKLAEICNDLKKEGKKIVQCHGCFDLLHPGHIYHFNTAKKYGYILVVTVTPDRFVHKGPGRPVFNARLRMESIASLEVVDYVSLNRWETAIETLKLLKPDFYVKGQDYSDRTEDITGNIILEEEAVKEGGGEIRFTDEITFSSSKIINRHFDVLSENARDYTEQFKKNFSSDDIIDILKDLKDLHVLVIGDAIIDEYTFCSAMGKPEKAAVVSTKYLYDEIYAGGSLMISNHVAGFAKSVHLVTTIGKSNSMEDFIREKLRANVNPKFFYRQDAPTIVKRRYIESFNNAKILEVSEINEEFVDRNIEHEITEYLEEMIPAVDLVLIADFGHGLITPNIQEEIAKKADYSTVNAQTNSANFGFNLITKYSDVDYISIDERELRLPYRAKFGDLEPLIEKLVRDTKCEKINVTLGSSGSIYYQDGKTYFVPVFSDNIVDTVGAGDAVLSITSMLAYRDIDPRIIPFVGNATGALAVKILGNKEPIDPIKLFKFIKYMME
jgi:rfaE bifunctional protein nucleotidyltransferase chain/domain